MIIKRYIASTIQDAMSQVKIEMGSDAIILNTRKIKKKGLLGLFKKPLMEVTAAIDEPIPIAPTPSIEPIMEEMPENNDSFSEIGQKVDAIEEMMERLVFEISQKPSKSNEELLYQKNPIYEALINNEVLPSNAQKIIEMTHELQKTYNLDSSNCFERVIISSLGGVPETIEFQPEQRKVVLLVGPTGVGKTTTLAKLAAMFTIEQGKKVGLITADTYRIAAVDQLNTYAEILGIPIDIIYSPNQITNVLKRHEDKEIVLIDTAGRSIRDDGHVEEINNLISLGNIDEVFLVISCNTSPQGCINIIKHYNFLSKYKLIFTKVDETTTYGTILNCCMLSN
ncbi:MAG TPA: flagellar biosynthesis protein FlhF, partial [Clostridia bacterium]|nr:flagellar biosynthesis protein FlhF [Clostridia bacterium]